MTDDDRITLIHDLVERISPILYGKGDTVQGAVLADLVSMWLAGHVCIGADATPEKTAQLRKEVFDQWIETVNELVPVNECTVLERLRNA